MKKCESLLAIILSYIFLAHAANPQKSCRDHYLHGKFRSGTFPLSKSQDTHAESYTIECEMPLDGGLHQSVATVVHSALERWKPVTIKQTVGYQISDREFLTKLISDSNNKCTQQISIRWTNPYNNNGKDEFTVESISGRQQTFKRNDSIPTDATVSSTLTGDIAGILHILPSVETTTNATVWVRVSEVRCTQDVIKTNECLFEINDPNDRIRFLGIHDSNRYVSFAFRTDQPWHRFMAISMKGAPHINIDLNDGYLLNVNHAIHPIKLLADGNWHTVRIDLRVLTLTIDDSATMISLYSGKSRSVTVESVEIFISGQITALQIDDASKWQCADSDRIQIQSTPQILRKICSSLYPPSSYCKCKGPNSALSSFRHKISNCTEPTNQNAYRLTRNSHELAFFYLKELNEKSRISVLFKSDSDVGLIFFGMVFRQKSVEEFVTRIQVHYINEIMYAARCVRGIDGTERCHSCSIQRKGGFSTNKWIRVSWFYYNVYQFLAVDYDICQLSPNSGAILDSSELYSPPSLDSFLFVGGYLYAKNSHTLHQINHDFRKRYGENTREKPVSLRGCIAEILVDGVSENLDEIFQMQLKDCVKNGKESLFSMKPGCLNCEEEGECHGARCRAPYPDIESKPTCDCASVFATTNLSPKRGDTDMCVVNHHDDDFDHRHQTLSLSSERHIKLESRRLPLNRRAAVDRVWFLMRFPEVNEELATILTFGAIRISVGSLGKRVIVEVDLIKEEFAVDVSDERLHLIAIQKNKLVGTAIEHKTLRVQLDSTVRTIILDEIPISDSYLLITPIVNDKIKENKGGCIEEFVIAYDYREDSHMQSPENHVELIDWLPHIISEAYDSGLILNDYCGIRDPNLWLGNSSSYGYVGAYDPYAGHKSTSWTIVLIVVAIALLILACIPYCICRQKRYRQYKAKKSGGKANGQSLHSNDTEKTPLTDESYMEIPRAKPVRQNGNGIHDTDKPDNNYGGDPLRSTRVSIRNPVEDPIKINDYPSSPRRSHSNNNKPILVRRVPPSPIVIEQSYHNRGSPGIALLQQPQYSSITKAPIAKPDEL